MRWADAALAVFVCVPRGRLPADRIATILFAYRMNCQHPLVENFFLLHWKNFVTEIVTAGKSGFRFTPLSGWFDVFRMKDCSDRGFSALQDLRQKSFKI